MIFASTFFNQGGQFDTVELWVVYQIIPYYFVLYLDWTLLQTFCGPTLISVALCLQLGWQLRRSYTICTLIVVIGTLINFALLQRRRSRSCTREWKVLGQCGNIIGYVMMVIWKSRFVRENVFGSLVILVMSLMLVEKSLANAQHNWFIFLWYLYVNLQIQ